MELRATQFAIVVGVVDLILGIVAHTEAVLPDLACFALNHEFTSICLVLACRGGG